MASKAAILSTSPSRLDTLAAAYAEAGKFDMAIKTQEEAISLLIQDGKSEELLEGYRERLTTYQDHKPWREE